MVTIELQLLCLILYGILLQDVTHLFNSNVKKCNCDVFILWQRVYSFFQMHISKSLCVLYYVSQMFFLFFRYYELQFLLAGSTVNTLWLVKKQLYIKMSPISSKMFIFLTPIKKKTQTTLNAAYPLLEPSVALLLQLKSAKRSTSPQKMSNKPNL